MRRAVGRSISSNNFFRLFVLMVLVAVMSACSSPEARDRPTAATTGATTMEPVSPATPAVATSPTRLVSTTGAALPAPTSATALPATPASATVMPTPLADPWPPVTITVLYDNTTLSPGTQAAWGFSCLVEGLEKTVLVDTGGDGDILLANMEALRVQPDDVDVVVLSHGHNDHTGGLAEFVAHNPDVTVYYPASLSASAVSRAQAAGASLEPVDAPVSICAGLIVISPMGSPAESGLLVETREGHVLITGCAHPGIVEMVTAAAKLVNGPVSAVLGGFHLAARSVGQVERIIHGLKELGVERCGPAHCTGERATAQLRAAFGDGFVGMGVGAIVVF